MDIQIVEDLKNRLQVIINCSHIDAEVTRLKAHIELFDSKLTAVCEKQTYVVDVSDVLYFEAVDNRIFLYTEDKVMEINRRLYELEVMLSDKEFIRTSKSQIININKIKSLKPEINRTLSVTMCSGELLYISRKYVSAVKKLLSI